MIPLFQKFCRLRYIYKSIGWLFIHSKNVVWEISYDRPRYSTTCKPGMAVILFRKKLVYIRETLKITNSYLSFLFSHPNYYTKCLISFNTTIASTTCPTCESLFTTPTPYTVIAPQQALCQVILTQPQITKRILWNGFSRLSLQLIIRTRQPPRISTN